MAEIPYENQLIVNTRKVNHGTVTHLKKLEFLQKNLLAAHTVWVDDTEVSSFFLTLPCCSFFLFHYILNLHMNVKDVSFLSSIMQF